MQLMVIPALITLAHAAGDAIMAIYQHDFGVSYKSDNSPLTAADEAAHEIIVAGLANLTPDIPVLSEESPASVMTARHSWLRYWLVDPLDGTKEFVARNGEFTVNIALIEAGKPVWGLVYAPELAKLWYGGHGYGAHCIEQGERRTITTQPHQAGEPWRVLGSRHHCSPATLDYLTPFGAIEFIAMGSSLKFCLIAEGRADLYPRLAPTCEWDTAAAQAVLEGAGGTVTQLDGSSLSYNKVMLLNPWFVAQG
jgi:3'(2'), 5'-bisphosphate nucleotidase